MTAMSLSAAESLAVKIIDRQNRDTVYSYAIPEHSTSTSNTDMNCSGSVNSLNCSGTTHTTGSSIPARGGSYEVRGATFSLQLPDGRVAVVNCESKMPPRALGIAMAVTAGTPLNRRSCRIPLVNDIQAEFSGDKAKLLWTVSVDGKKLESETYQILAVLDKL
jgi:hypothetical protein